MFNLANLSTFCALSRLRNVTSVAAKMHLTPPGVMHQIRTLENHFNTRLVQRDGRRYRLTESGRVLLRYAEEMLVLYELARRQIAALEAEVSGNLVLATGGPTAPYIAPYVIRWYRQRYNNVGFTLDVYDVPEALDRVERHMADFAIIEADVSVNNIEAIPLTNISLYPVVAANHPLLRTPNLRYQDLVAYPLLTREKHKSSRRLLEQRLAEIGCPIEEFTDVLEFGSAESLKVATELGLGVSFFSPLAIQRELDCGSLQFLPLEPLVNTVHICRNKDSLKPRAAETFWLEVHTSNSLRQLRAELNHGLQVGLQVANFS